MFAFCSTFAVFVGLVRLTCALPTPGAAGPASAACTAAGAAGAGVAFSIAPSASPLALIVAPVRLSPDEALVLQIVNEERRAGGFRCLELDPTLVQAARAHSLDMARRGYFDHIAPAPAPTTPLDRYAAALGRRPEGVVGENIGRAAQPLMAVIHNQMMESQEHKANITDVEYVRMGVGVYEMADGRVWVTEMFSGDAPANVPPESREASLSSTSAPTSGG